MSNSNDSPVNDLSFNFIKCYWNITNTQPRDLNQLSRKISRHPHLVQSDWFTAKFPRSRLPWCFAACTDKNVARGRPTFDLRWPTSANKIFLFKPNLSFQNRISTPWTHPSMIFCFLYLFWFDSDWRQSRYVKWILQKGKIAFIFSQIECFSLINLTLAPLSPGQSFSKK